MNKYSMVVGLIALVLLLPANFARAIENNAVAGQEAASKDRDNQNVVKRHIEARQKAAVRSKPVDLNHATSKQLQKLPGISDAVAKKIIAGRPYVSNRDLLTRNVINKEIYDNIKRRIYVMPHKDNVSKK